MAPTSTIYGLQMLRAVAAIVVVIFHATWRAGDGWHVGQAGVDIFFVISGFIMWVLSERRPTPGEFIRDRVVRIVPLYWVATGGMVAGGLIGAFPNLELDPAHVIASFLFLPYASPNGGETWPLLVQGWTLNYEMFFYVLFALVLLAPRSAHLAILWSALAVCSAIGVLITSGGVALDFYTDSILLEFAAGVGIGALWTSNRLPSKAMGWALTLAACAMFVALSFVEVSGPRFLVWGGPSALLVLGVCTLERRGVTLSTPWLLFLGNASYSIYLFHTFAISIVARLFGDRLGFVLESILSTLGGIAVGALVYLLIEKPLTAFFKRKRPPGRLAPA